MAGRLADAGRVSDPGSGARRSRIVNARHSPCRMKPDAVLSRPCPGSKKRKRLPVGCGHHPAIFGPARTLRHPACPPRKRGMHATTHFRTAQTARGPPDFPIQNSGVQARGGFSRVVLQRNRTTHPDVDTLSGTRHCASPLPLQRVIAACPCRLPLPRAARLWHQCRKHYHCWRPS